MPTTTVSQKGANLTQLLAQPSQPGGENNLGDLARGEEHSRVSLANWLRCVPFILLHLAPLAILWTGVDLTALLLCAACYLVNMVGITVGYHRYF